MRCSPRLVLGLVLISLLLAACADEPETLLTPDAARYASFKNLSGWSAPTALASLNTAAATEGCPFITKRGDVLYFASSRSGGYGMLDLYVSRWDAEAQAWGQPENLGPEINTGLNEQCPLVLNSGKEMIFVSNRSGSVSGSLDLWIATRHDHRDDLAWESPRNLAALNTGSAEFGPGAYEDENGATVVYFNSNRIGIGAHDLYRSTRSRSGTFSSPTLVTELSTTGQEQFAALSKDGREIFFSSDRSGTLGGLDLWSATRERTSDPWGAPVNLGGSVNSTAAEGRSAISWDGRTLVYHSTRVTGANPTGSVDLYRSTRTRVTGPRS